MKKKLLDPRWFKTLPEADIEEKIQLNLKEGFTLPGLRDKLEQELFQNRRLALYERARRKIFDFKFKESQLTLDIQAQNLIEQIAYIDRKLRGGK